MVEEAAEDSIAGQDSTRTHRFIHSPRHLEHSVSVACIDDKVEDFGVGQADTLCLQLADNLKQLVRAEELLFLVLLP